MIGIIRYLRIFALALLAALVCFAALNARPDSAQAAVTLLYFQGQHNGDSVLLEWATATELDTAYFYIERASLQSGPYQMLDEIGLILSEAPPDGLSGAQYQRLDEDNIAAGQIYWYVLVEVENTQGIETRTQPIRVALGDAQPTSTATKAATTSPPPSATPTTTPTPAELVSQTASPTPTRLPTGPTATPSAGRAVTIRSSATPAATSQAIGQATGPSSVTDNQGAVVVQAEDDPVTVSEGYPDLDREAAVIAMQSDPDGYPVSLPTPEVFATKSYPAPVSPRDLTNGDGDNGDGATVSSIGSNNQAASAGQAAASTTAANSPELGTLFLWLGFAASLVVFVSAVAGAIYYYSKQRSG